MAQLPLYYKNSKAVGPSQGRRWQENYLLLLIFVAFVMLIAGTWWYIPTADEEDGEYEKVYNKFNPTVNAVGRNVAPFEPTLVPPEKHDERGEEEERNSHKLDREGVDEANNEIAGNGRKAESPIKEAVVEEEVEKEESPLQSEIKEEEALEGRPIEEERQAPAAAAAAVDPENEKRRLKTIDMAKKSWDAYVQYAWGENELKPMARRGHSAVVFGKSAMGATIVDSLDTLYLMGLHDEFQKGVEWVRDSLHFEKISGDISVFEINIRYVGGLLSAYALSGEKEAALKDKAVAIADKLMPAFNTPSGIPKSLVNVQTGGLKNWGWSSGGSSILAEFGSLHLEFQYLTHLTGNHVYLDKVARVRQKLRDLDKPNGLYPNFLNPNTGSWGSRQVSMGALGDSFYEYLLKSWLGTSKDDTLARDMFYDAIDAIDTHMVKSTAGHMYVSDLRNGRPDMRMQHLTCFSGGLFGLAAKHATNGRAARYHEIGQGVTKTCYKSYEGTASKLGPEAFRFDGAGGMTSRSNEKMYLLRPETVESIFVMWRMTHDQQYRDWGWEVVQALNRHCLTDSGAYSGIRDVYSATPPKDDVMQSFFLAETLKYLFLLFSDDSVLPLDSWVLNTEAHPLPVLSHIPRSHDQAAT